MIIIALEDCFMAIYLSDRIESPDLEVSDLCVPPGICTNSSLLSSLFMYIFSDSDFDTS